MEPVGDGQSVKVYCHQRGGQPQHREDPGERQEKGIAQARGTGRGEVRAFWLEGNMEKRTDNWRATRGGGFGSREDKSYGTYYGPKIET